MNLDFYSGWWIVAIVIVGTLFGIGLIRYGVDKRSILVLLGGWLLVCAAVCVGIFVGRVNNAGAIGMIRPMSDFQPVWLLVVGTIGFASCLPALCLSSERFTGGDEPLRGGLGKLFVNGGIFGLLIGAVAAVIGIQITNQSYIAYLKTVDPCQLVRASIAPDVDIPHRALIADVLNENLSGDYECNIKLTKEVK